MNLKNNMQKIILTILTAIFSISFFSVVSAQETQNLNISADVSVPYTEILEFDQNEDEQIDKWTYKNQDSITLTAYDTNNDKKPDLWLKYDKDQVLALEIHDTNKDGTPDIFFELSGDEKIKNKYGDGLKKFERPETKIFTPQQETTLSNEELLGDLSDLDPEKSGSMTIVLIFILLGAAVWWYLKSKRK
jgi:hypothetical protein